MCPKRTLSSPLLLRITIDSILPSWKIWICACPCDSVAQAGTSMSDRIWVLNTIGGASSLATLASSATFSPVMGCVLGADSVHAATATAAPTPHQQPIDPPPSRVRLPALYS